MKKGLDVNVLLGDHKDTPLLNYIMGTKLRDDNEVFFPSSKFHLKILNLLKKNGIKLNAQRLLGDKRFALSWVTDLSILKWMLKNGARLDMHAQDNLKRTAFGQMCDQFSDSAGKQILNVIFPYVLGELKYDIYENGKCTCYEESVSSGNDYIYDNHTSIDEIHDTWNKCTFN